VGSEMCIRDRPRTVFRPSVSAAWRSGRLSVTQDRFRMTYVFIALFAIIGAFARYGQTLVVQGVLGRSFPFATLSINVLGSFLMGFLFFETLERINLSPELRTGILTGGLGAYTTFSTFSLESLNLIENGEMVKAGLYIGASVVLSIAAAIFGAFLSRNMGVST